MIAKVVLKLYCNLLAENFIDGRALLMLPKDYEEFCHLVPQSGIRMKLKLKSIAMTTAVILKRMKR